MEHRMLTRPLNVSQLRSLMGFKSQEELRYDLDNFIKLVKDALNKIFWVDDSQIVEVQAKKIYDINSYTEVEIEPLEVSKENT